MKNAIIDAVKMIGAILAFLVLYGLADWIGGHTPFWIGMILLLAGLGGLITVMIKIAKDGF